MKEKQIEEIQKFAIDIQNVSMKASNIIMEEMHNFVSKNHKYSSLADFHKAHPKGRTELEAEFLYELGYRRASDVAREFIEAVDEMMNLVTAMTGLSLTYHGKYAELKKKYEEEQ